MNENESASPRKVMYWTGVVMSVIPSLMLLMASVMSLSKSAQVLQGMAQFGYPENAIPAIGAACLVSTVLYIIPRTAVLGAILLTGYLGGAVATHVRARPRNSRFSCRSFSPRWSGAGSFFATRAFGICSLGGNRNDFERPTEHTGSPGRGHHMISHRQPTSSTSQWNLLCN